MAKIVTKILLAASLLGWLSPALADMNGSSNSTATAADANDAATDENTHRRIDHPHYPSDWIPSRRIIMSAKGLTDKQKSDIEQVYDDSQARFAALDLEYHDLRKSNWEKIEAILTKDQSDEVLADQHNLTHPNSPLPADIHTNPMKRVKHDPPQMINK